MRNVRKVTRTREVSESEELRNTYRVLEGKLLELVT
jgi:hypothetical protein